MKVADLIKNKKDSNVKSSVELNSLVSPAIKAYWSELLNKANTQVFPWSSRPSSADSSHAVKVRTGIHPAEKRMLENQLPEAAQVLYQELQLKLGEIVHVGDWLSMSQDRINQFAKVTEDTQWIHTDPDRAQLESPFKTTIAHGFLTLAMLSRLTDSVDDKNPPFPTAKMTVNIGLNQVRFPYPVKAGDNIRAQSRLLKVTPVKRGLEIEREIRVEIEGCRRPGCVAVSVIRVYF